MSVNFTKDDKVRLYLTLRNHGLGGLPQGVGWRLSRMLDKVAEREAELIRCQLRVQECEREAVGCPEGSPMHARIERAVAKESRAAVALTEEESRVAAVYYPALTDAGVVPA